MVEFGSQGDRVYRSYYQLMQDLPYLHNTTILVTRGFEYSLIDVNSLLYKSLKEQLERQNITVIFIKKKRRK